MRKLLLATVAALGASMGVASVAEAQAPSPAPGTVTVRLNGRFRFYGAVVFDRDVDNNLAGSTTGLTQAGATGSTGRNKQANYTFGDYARLYPGFDGVAANGLRYGASLEIRQDNGAGAGGGQFGSISNQSRSRNTLYFRKLWGYLGTNTLGTIRLGSTDGPTSLYMTGNFENFNDGGLNGDVPSLQSPATAVIWPFADVGNFNTGTKAMYLSPQFFGFDFGVSFEPNTGNGGVVSNCGGATFANTNFTNVAGSFVTAGGANATGVSGPGCDRLSSTPVNAESQRRRNTFDGILRYRGSFGGAGVAATGGYIYSSNVKDNSGFAFGLRPAAAGATAGTFRGDFEGLSVADFGVAVTFGGLSVGGKYQFGRFATSWGLVPDDVGVKNGVAWLVGASYTAGPLIVGAHYLDYQHAGDTLNAIARRERREQGVGAGGTYALAPGVSLFASYIYAQRRQNGLNFITGQGASVTAGGGINAGNPNNNKTVAQVFALGTSFSW